MTEYTITQNLIPKRSTTALVVEGGAMRSVFSAGLLDGFLARDFNPFDCYLGVSAGAYNLTTYLCGAVGASLRTYLTLARQQRFIDYARFLRGGHLLDLDWLFDAALRDAPIDLDAIDWHGKAMYVVVTDVASGEARYIKTNADTIIETIKASAALPLLYRDFLQICGQAATDGGVADGIPVAYAMAQGARLIMVVRSRPQHYRKRDSLGHAFIRWRLRGYPQLTATMRRRVEIFEQTMKVIRQPPPGIEIIEVCPPEQLRLGRFSRARKRLQAAYNIGREMSDEVIRQWESQNQPA